MRLRSLLLFLVATVTLAGGFAVPAAASTTPTEAAATAAASNDHTAYTLPPDKLAKSQALQQFRVKRDFAGPIWQILTLFLMLQLGIIARMRDLAVKFSTNHWAQGFTFFFQFLLLSSLLNLPLDMYSHTVSVDYGLSVQGWASWFSDKSKVFALTFAVGGLIVMLVFHLIRKYPRKWWLVLWFPTMLFTVIGIFLTPYVIDPIFNKFEPLATSNPALVQQLQKVVAKGNGINIPPERMFLMKASDKVTTVNAYVTGFGSSKRVVVWDTSIAKATPDEILFIFGHEMGHYVLGHIVSGILTSFVLVLVQFYLGFQLVQVLLRTIGQRWHISSQSDWGALAVFGLALGTVGFLFMPIDNSFSRMQEHAADVYGLEVVHGIVANPQATGQAAFQLLGESSFVDPNPSAFAEFWTDSHPSIASRAAFAKHYNPWAPGEDPKYLKK